MDASGNRPARWAHAEIPSSADCDNGLIDIAERTLHNKPRRHKAGAAECLLHGADSPENSSTRIRNFIKIESEPNLNPALPKDLKNRIADNWRPLISIADCFGPVWGKLARETAMTFAHAHHDEDAGVILLSDIRSIFNRTAADRMTSVDLITALLDIEESGWSEYRGMRDDQQPKKLSAGEMARLLRPFGIRLRSIWPAMKRHKGSGSRKGYYRWQFEEAWRRYCDEPAGTAAQKGKIRLISNQ